MIRIAACDDNPIQLSILEEFLEDCRPELDEDIIVSSFTSAAELTKARGSQIFDIYFLDIIMPKESGMELARKIRNSGDDGLIIFLTTDKNYALESYDVEAFRYMVKPMDKERCLSSLQAAIKHINMRRAANADTKVTFQCFGYFEVFANDKAIKFKHTKTKEVLAFLVDAKGAMCTNAEICANIWDDEGHEEYLKVLKRDLLATLQEYDCEEILVAQRGKMGIDTSKVSADYYEYLKGVKAMSPYNGEYMKQYPWAETTNSGLYFSEIKKQ